MRTDEDALKEYIEGVFGWPERPDLRVGGAENEYDVIRRFENVVLEAHAAGLRDVAMISHGAVIRAYAAARATNVAADYAAEHWLHNTGMVVLEGTPTAGWEMTRWEEDPLGIGELVDRRRALGAVAPAAARVVPWPGRRSPRWWSEVRE